MTNETTFPELIKPKEEGGKMTTAKALIEKFQCALANAWGYIWGAYGQL